MRMRLPELSHVAKFWIALASMVVVVLELIDWAAGHTLSAGIKAAADLVWTTSPFDIVGLFLSSAGDKIAQVLFTGTSSYSCAANEIGCWQTPVWAHWVPLPGFILLIATFNGLYQALSVQGLATLWLNVSGFLVTALFIVPVTNAVIGPNKFAWLLGVIIDVFLLVLLGSVVAWALKLIVLALLKLLGAILSVIVAIGGLITVSMKGAEIAELTLVARRARRQAESEMG